MTEVKTKPRKSRARYNLIQMDGRWYRQPSHHGIYTRDEVLAEMARRNAELGERLEPRDAVLPPVRVSADERERIKAEAKAAGLSVGAYIRKRLGLD